MQKSALLQKAVKLAVAHGPSLVTSNYKAFVLGIMASYFSLIVLFGPWSFFWSILVMIVYYSVAFAAYRAAAYLVGGFEQRVLGTTAPSPSQASSVSTKTDSGGMSNADGLWTPLLD